MSLKERFRELIDGPKAKPGRRVFLRDMAIVVGGGAVLAACGVKPRAADNTPLPTNIPDGSSTPGGPDAYATAKATNAPTQAETETQPATEPAKQPTNDPEPQKTEAPSAMETFGPVEVTGEEYKLLHTQNVVAFKEKDSEGNNVWEMIPPETYAARNEAVLTIRQRVMDKLAAETGATPPENNFNSYLAWLNQLKASGRIDGAKLWEYASNMPITNEEIKALVENRTPENQSLEFPQNLEPGLNYDSSDKVYSVRLPDGTTVENKVPTAFQAKVLAVVPTGLISGLHKDATGVSYAIIGEPNNKLPFTIIAIVTKNYGDIQVSAYFNNDKDVSKMPRRWWGWYIPGHNGVGVQIFTKAKSRDQLGNALYYGGSRTTSLLLTSDTWLRAYWIFPPGSGPQFNLDPNGVVQLVHDTIAFAQG